ncbi:Lrp/AsnC family transcriptional regulator [Streptomyces sp. NPDC060053]|uniref:Lrp/AsnC family transcriptional regulator n=1 Tax=Streptomyces sp. NPDC060053 TaxID=3347047 RepID=UPI00368EFF7C
MTPGGRDGSARVGLTTGPCLRRVQRLEADGVIRGYRAVVDPTAMGSSFEVLIDLSPRPRTRRRWNASNRSWPRPGKSSS